MELHRFDERTALVPYGEITLGAALDELRAAAERAAIRYESVEESMAQTSFTLSRDRRDFLQVNCDGPDDIWFLSDRLVPPASLLARLFNIKTTLAFRCDVGGAERVLRDYIGRSREAFESRYASAYVHRNALPVDLEPPPA